MRTDVNEIFDLLNNSPDISQILKKSSSRNNVFDTIFSNPPYQLKNNNGAVGIYHQFMNISQLLGNNVSMIYPSRWMFVGKGEGIDVFRENELNSCHYLDFFQVSDSTVIFPDATIKGGVNYFLWKFDKDEPLIKYSYNGSFLNRNTLIDGFVVMIQNNDFIEIIKKIDIGYSIVPESGGFYGDIIKTSEKIKKLSKMSKKSDKKISVYFSGISGGVFRESISRSFINKDVDDYKVFISKTADPDSKGSLRRPGRIFIGRPDEVCSNSFLKFGNFRNINDAKNALIFLKSDFATFLFGVITTTQDAYRKSYRLIPDVDFATGEIKDKPGIFLNFDDYETLDEQLANIYKLTNVEKDLMKKSIKPWKDKFSLTEDGLF